MTRKDMETIFKTVLRANKEYAKAVDTGASGALQEVLLAGCDALFKSMILEAGLVNEYAEYCKIHTIR